MLQQSLETKQQTDGRICQGTGRISSRFVEDIVTNPPPSPEQFTPSSTPHLYGSYENVYEDPDVDIVYIGTPHSFHHRNALDAIQAGKHVLCEKPFTLNLEQAREVVETARKKGVFLMEAMWTRYYPLTRELRRQIHEEKLLGDVYRMFSDFGLDLDIPSMPRDSRYVQPSLGAGGLLDVGIYSLTWALLTLDPGVGVGAEMPRVLAAQTIEYNVDATSSVILQFPSTGRHGIVTCTTKGRQDREFMRVEGPKGVIKVEGSMPSSPESFTFYPRDPAGEVRKFSFEKPGWGF
ncbi:hypothetical protein PV08_02868 [Exophiala spinifera]|uniref:D-xylose 1-dehydrogenase (NADP(+), D-xylono-1,5-lactone-forming) n=1 Tax=Exophiala spinifera TaxID=91928 RepID=A0A0D2BJ36_9EURO|nr:uncharacterized protein PV08_02868 [Exophiala spinifera]KIW18580.1 hypothetical protein PV08_02868 [Exophiala spinifera]